MPDIFKILSPISLLIGAVGAVATVAVLWPVPSELIAAVGLIALLAFAVISEIVRRLMGSGE